MEYLMTMLVHLVRHHVTCCTYASSEGDVSVFGNGYQHCQKCDGEMSSEVYERWANSHRTESVHLLVSFEAWEAVPWVFSEI